VRQQVVEAPDDGCSRLEHATTGGAAQPRGDEALLSIGSPPVSDTRAMPESRRSVDENREIRDRQRIATDTSSPRGS
jgi:hypothetical protein